MKVLLAADFPRSNEEIRGGTWAASHNLAEALIRYTDVSIMTVSFRSETSSPELLSKHDGRLLIRRFPLGRYRSLINHLGQRRTFERLIREWQPDVVHAQGEGLYASLATASRRPNIYTIHGIRLKEIDMSRQELGAIRSFLWRHQIKAHHRRATNIIVINNYTEQAISGLHDARIWRIPNAVRQDLFDVGSSRYRPRSCNILLVGGVRRRKDILTAVDVVKNLQNESVGLRLHIVGPNDDPEYLEIVQDHIRACGVEANVTIHGLVEDEKLINLYDEADAFLLTSVEESSPISIVEAMAVGLPIVSTNVGGIAEMVEQNAILCDSGDVGGVANALRRVLGDNETRIKMGRLSREIARSKWSDEAVAKATHEAYREMINGT